MFLRMDLLLALKKRYHRNIFVPFITVEENIKPTG